jgi:hypothetical protein
MPELILNSEQQVLVGDVFSSALTELQNHGELGIDTDKLAFSAVIDRLKKDPDKALMAKDRKTQQGRSETIGVVNENGRYVGDTITLAEEGSSLILSNSKEKLLPPKKSQAIIQLRINTRSLTPKSNEDITRYASALPDIIAKACEKPAERAAVTVSDLRRHQEAVHAKTKLSETDIILQRAYFDPEQGRIVSQNYGVITFTDRIGDFIDVSVATSGRRDEHTTFPVAKLTGPAFEAVSTFLSAITNRS